MRSFIASNPTAALFAAQQNEMRSRITARGHGSGLGKDIFKIGLLRMKLFATHRLILQQPTRIWQQFCSGCPE
jgi:hypothetical protein